MENKERKISDLTVNEFEELMSKLLQGRFPVPYPTIPNPYPPGHTWYGPQREFPDKGPWC